MLPACRLSDGEWKFMVIADPSQIVWTGRQSSSRVSYSLQRCRLSS
jgi:hypothetical protein